MPVSIITEINYLAVLFSAVLYFSVGLVWYSPKKLGLVWSQLNYLKVDNEKNTSTLLGMAFLSTLTASFILSYFVYLAKASSLVAGSAIGILTGFAVVTMTVGFSFVSTERQIKMYLADAGYHLIGFMLMGMILSVWR